MIPYIEAECNYSRLTEIANFAKISLYFIEFVNKLFKYKNFIILSFVYLLIRIVSFFLYDDSIVFDVIAGILVCFYAFICFKNLNFAWKILVLEILLGGSGHFFEWHGLILRTWFLGIFALFWLWQIARKKRKIIWPEKQILLTLAIFGVFLLFAIINGFLRHHSPLFIIQDAILYLFLLLLFPAMNFINNFKSIYLTGIKVLIVCSTLFSVLTFVLYSGGWYILNNPFYHWFRNVAAGKITDLGFNFFRIVLPEHILFIPIILVILSCLFKKMYNKKMWLFLFLSLIVLLLNFTRIYIISLVVGGLVLLYQASWKKWLITMSLTLFLSSLIFFGFNFMGSRGESFGLELVGMKADGISRPSSDLSGAIRLALLPDIIKTIRTNPWFGSGLATTVTYFSPLNREYETRTQFDWGYLEMVAELGIIGTVLYLALLVTIIINFARVTNISSSNSHVSRGLLAGAIALFIINITTPALFQGFGVIYFAFLGVLTKYPGYVRLEKS